MVEGAPLLREYTGNGIEGSNPFVSATNHVIYLIIKNRIIPYFSCHHPWHQKFYFRVRSTAIACSEDRASLDFRLIAP